MRTTILLSILLFTAPTGGAIAQNLYFPPNGSNWDTLSPTALGWCTDSIQPLYDFLDSTNSKAFLVLKDGRIVLEKYFDTFTQDSLWYWASAGKTMTAFLVGMAQQEGLLSIEDTTSTYLGNGWTNCPPAKEEMITVRHQLSMTTGLDDGGGNNDCTDPACLTYLADSGTRWAYHNAPYTLLDSVIENATGQTLNAYLFSKLSLSTGLFGAYVPVGYNNVLFSTPRSLARFGLLMLADGTWNGTPIMTDQVYLNAMRSPSQSLNESYGYLWWLNGQSSHMLPGLQFVFPGPLCPNAPMDMYAAMGKNGQILNVVPSQGLLVVRMGDLPDTNIFVPNFYNDDIWQRLNTVMCTNVAISEVAPVDRVVVHPNPANGPVRVELDGNAGLRAVNAIAVDGRNRALPFNGNTVNTEGLAEGTYTLLLRSTDDRLLRTRLVVVR